MNQIISNLQDPSWWFTGLFFLLIGFAVRKLATSLPKLNDILKRKRRLKVLKTIKFYRRNDLKIQWLIGRYWSLATICMALMILSIYVFALMPSTSTNYLNLALPSITFLISYTSLFNLLREKEILSEVLEENEKLKKKIPIRVSDITNMS